MKRGIILMVVLLSFEILYCQNSDPTKDEAFYIAEEMIYEENFKQAIALYQKLLSINPDNPDLNFKMGFCYLHTPVDKEMSIKYLEKAMDGYKQKFESKKIPMESFYYLAKAYHINYKFDKAIPLYKELPQRTKNKKIIKIAQRGVEECKNGLDLMHREVNISVNNLGSIVNSKYSEHSPIVSLDGNSLIFTSRRVGNPMVQSPDGQFNEDIYISVKSGNKWTKPKPISKNINTKEHEASLCLSGDGKELYLYKSEDNGSIYLSRFSGKDWSVPVKLNSNINTRHRETSASISADGNYLYFTSDRKGTLGGLDIWVSKRNSKGDWDEPQNLGPNINTEYDEESPFILADNSFLYFSSQGHQSIGGFDIFHSYRKLDGTFSNAQNIGYPISTADNDIFLMISADKKFGYYASEQKSGFGQADIYQIVFNDKLKEILTVFSGSVASMFNDSIKDVKINVINSENGDTLGKYFANYQTGDYLFTVGKHSYVDIAFEAPNYYFNFDEFSRKSVTPTNVVKDQFLVPLSYGMHSYEMKFTKENSKIYPNASVFLNTLAKLMNENDYLILTLSLPKKNTNHEILKNRISEIITYLVAHNVAEERIMKASETVQELASTHVLFTLKGIPPVIAEGFNDSTKKGDIPIRNIIFSDSILSHQNNLIADTDNKDIYQDSDFNDYADNQSNANDKNYTDNSKSQKNTNDNNNQNNFNNNTNNKVHNKLSENDYFVIQVGAFHRKVNTKVFKGLSSVKMFYCDNQWYKYVYGKYKNLDEANKELLKVHALGYSDAFIRTDTSLKDQIK